MFDHCLGLYGPSVDNNFVYSGFVKDGIKCR